MLICMICEPDFITNRSYRLTQIKPLLMKDIMIMEAKILSILEQSIAVKKAFVEANAGRIASTAKAIADCLKAGGKVLVLGNGGSAADAQHIAAEFVGRFAFDRPPLPAIALTTDTSILTCTGNDYGFGDIFVRQVTALARTGDIVWGISTSGNSENVVRALSYARKQKIATIGLAGKGGGRMAALCDHLLAVDGPDTARIQEAHGLVGHILCGLVEELMFPDKIPGVVSDP